MNHQHFKAHLALFSAGCIWGLMAPIGKLALEGGVNSLSLTAFRMGGAALCFWIASLFIPREKVARKDMILLFFASLLGIVFNQGLFIFGLSLTSPVDASIITTALPIITLTLSVIFLNESLRPLKILGILMGTTGALLLILNHEAKDAFTSNIWGNLMCVGAQISFASYLVLFKKLIQKYHNFTLMKWLFLYASLCFWPFSYSSLKETFSASLSVETLLEAGYVVFFGTFVAYMLIMIGQKALRPTVISMYNYVLPVVGAGASILMGLGHFGWGKAFASALIFLGVFIVTQSKGGKPSLEK